MALFGRKRRDDDADGPDADADALVSDSRLTFFSVAEAARLRALVREVLAEQGYEVTLHADHVVDDAGRRYGLWNVAAACARYHPGHWRELVAGHFRTMFDGPRVTIETMDDPTLLAGVHLRLVEDDALRSLDDPADYVLDSWAPGVSRVVAVDTPHTVLTPRLADLEARFPREVLLEHGWANLLEVLGTEPFATGRVEREGCWFTAVEGESFFTASLALVLPDVLARFEPGVAAVHGVLVAVPNRHELAFRVLTDAQAVLDGLLMLPGHALTRFSGSPGPVSPNLLHWREGDLTCVSRPAGGRVTVTPGPYLQRLLDGR